MIPGEHIANCFGNVILCKWQQMNAAHRCIFEFDIDFIISLQISVSYRKYIQKNTVNYYDLHFS